jgi:predicted dinucleotide-binding enzyme
VNTAVRSALSSDHTVSITTTGRKTRQPRTVEIWFHRVDGRYYLTAAVTVAEAMGAEVVLLATPWTAVEAVLRNHLPFFQLTAPVHDGERRASFLSGDDDAAKADVAAVLQHSGFAPIDPGGLHAGSLLQQVGGPLASVDLRLAK